MNCITRWPIRVRWGLVLLWLAVSLFPLSLLNIHGGNSGQVRTTCLVHLRSESECDIMPDAHQPKPRYARAKLLGPEYGKSLLQVRPFLPLNRHSYFSMGHRREFDSWHFNTALLNSAVCHAPSTTQEKLCVWKSNYRTNFIHVVLCLSFTFRNRLWY